MDLAAEAADSATRAARRSVGAWVLYDLANTSFAFVVLSFYFGPWLTQDLGAPDSAFTVTQSVSVLVVLLFAPILGAVSDRTGRKPFLISFTVLSVLATAALGVGEFLGVEGLARIAVPALIFAAANVGFQMGLVFYDALLPTVSSPTNVGRVGGTGVGVGYLGSVVGGALGYVILQASTTGEPLLFASTALVFWLVAMPAFFLVREPRRPGAWSSGLFWLSARSVVATLRSLPKRRQLSRFLVARILYADAINTFGLIIGIYAVFEAGFLKEELEYTLLLGLGALFAAGGAPAWGVLVDRLGPKRVLTIALFVWILTCAIVVIHPLLNLPQATFYVVGALGGLALGGTWTADRPLLLAIAPPDQVAQHFGLYAMAGRFAAVTGPLLWSLIVDVFRWGRPTAVAALSVFFLVALIVLRRLDVPPSGAVGGHVPVAAPD